MYENMSDEQIRKAIDSYRQKMRDNPNDANCSECWAPAIHYYERELERRENEHRT